MPDTKEKSSQTVTVETAHGEPVTVDLDDMRSDPEVRRQLGAVVKDAVTAGARASSGRPERAPGIAGTGRFSPPPEDTFKEMGVEFIESEALGHIADNLIERHKRLAHLAHMTVRYGWKKEGGNAGGRARLGQCMKPTGIARQYIDADFVIWLAADHLAILGWGEKQIEALVYHEMLHAGFNKHGEPVIWPHEFEGFFSELEHYPDVLPTWQAVGDVLQKRLPGM